jgi:hypothetical protein
MICIQRYLQDDDVAQCGTSATSELTQQSGSLIRLASGAPTVHLYDTFLGGLQHLPPQMKNQHRLNEENNFIGKK